jgi:hypothetical protein
MTWELPVYLVEDDRAIPGRVQSGELEDGTTVHSVDGKRKGYPEDTPLAGEFP